jgi:Rrf2 family transcriptional regulator, cysteine metabolism repressor
LLNQPRLDRGPNDTAVHFGSQSVTSVCQLSVLANRKGAPMKLSRTAGYALVATLQLAQSDPSVPIPCSRLAAQGRMPERFLLQILRSLVTHGILRSTRGVEGGYTLKRRAEDISLLDVIEAVDGPLQTEPPNCEGLPQRLLNQLADAMEEVNATARQQLSDIKMSSLLPPPPKLPKQSSVASQSS